MHEDSQTHKIKQNFNFQNKRPEEKNLMASNTKKQEMGRVLAAFDRSHLGVMVVIMTMTMVMAGVLQNVPEGFFKGFVAQNFLST